MKKFLAIALIAASLTSCGGGKTEETPANDSAALAPVEAPAMDSAAAPAVDTAKAADTTKPAAAPTK